MSSGAGKPAPRDLSSHTLHIDDLLANGQGVGRDEKLVAFVTGALPGEDVRIAVDAIKPNYVSAHAVEIVHASTDRIESVCPVFPRCGGCQTLHLRYEAQLLWKQRLVADALARIARLEGIRVQPTVGSDFFDSTRYRNKVSLVGVSSHDSAAVGFYAARSHRVVPIANCPVLLPWLDDAVRAFIALVKKTPQLLRDVRHVVVRTGVAHQTLVLALCTSRERADLSAVVNPLRRAIPALTGLVATWDPSSANAIFGRRFATLWGSPETIERVAGASFHFGVASFFQINTGILERIAAVVLDELAGARRIVDLYCGVGTFAVLAGKRGITATGVESYRDAVDEAAANAAINGITSAAFECASVVEALSGERGRTLLEGADIVILDPPRRGCEPAELDALAASSVARLLYLSCNPATLARDARRLVDAGYTLGSVRPFDMFPFTGHVETLADFTRA